LRIVGRFNPEVAGRAADALWLSHFLQNSENCGACVTQRRARTPASVIDLIDGASRKVI